MCDIMLSWFVIGIKCRIYISYSLGDLDSDKSNAEPLPEVNITKKSQAKLVPWI